MKNLICKLFGHKWKTHWKSNRTETYTFMQCERCNEPGWST